MSQSQTWTYSLVVLLVCLVSPALGTTASSLPDTAYVQLTETTPAEVKNCSFPNNVTATVTLGADVITLGLHRNDHVSSHAQVLLIKETADGSTVVQPYTSPLDENYGLYQDKNRSASIMLKCPKNGESSFIIEGTFLYGERTLRLTHFRRKRRDASPTESTAEEYNLVVEKAAAAALADFKQPPADKPAKTVAFQEFRGLPLPAAPPVRRRRQSTRYYVDVIAVIDYAVYREWYQRSEQTTAQAQEAETLSNIRRYFALIMNGVDLRYQTIDALPYRINIRLIGYVVAQTTGAAPWTERFRTLGSPRYVVNADSVLTAFSDWAASTDSLPSYDHAVLFTGYDLFTISGSTMKTATTGLAYIGTLCSPTGKSVSVVEETGAFISTETTAHEIGHSMSAKHDGDGNACSSNDRYIMAAGGSGLDTANKVNSWYFSSCSVDYFKNFINNMMRSSRGIACLTTPLPVLNVPDVSVLPGQLYDPDAQCRQLHGSQSRLCRGPEFGSAASICTSMYCYDPSTSKTCYEHVAARGTSCGDQKWCINGQCVYSPEAPRKDDSCVFGDQEGTAFDNKDCATFVAGYPGYCYQNVVRGRCCRTCSKYYRPLSNCEYGDKVASCQTSGCGYVYQDGSRYDEQCCGTCNYGTPLSTTTTPTAVTFAPTFTPRPTTRAVTPPPPETCRDSESIQLNGQPCSAYLQSNRAACYDPNVRNYCCGTCQAFNTGVSGCEFGDRLLQCQAAGCGFTFPEGSIFNSYDEACCETCNYSRPSTASTSGPTPSTTLPNTTETTSIRTTTTSTTTRTTTPSTTTRTTTPSTTTRTTTPSTTTRTTTPTTTTRTTTPSTTTRTTTPSTTIRTTTPSTTTRTTTPSTTTRTTTPSTTTRTTTPSTTTRTAPSTTTRSTTPSTTMRTTTPATTTRTATLSTTTRTTTPSTTTRTTTPPTTTRTTTSATTTASGTTGPSITPRMTTTPSPTTSTTATAPVATTAVATETPTTQPTTMIDTEDGCYDDDRNATVQCQDIVGSSGKFLCYDSSVARACCLSCLSQIDTQSPGCEYGDREPLTCGSVLIGKTTCSSSLQASCCATCKTIENEVNAQAALTSHKSLWIVAALGLLKAILS